MLLPENFSPIFTNKSKSTGNNLPIGATNSPNDIIEHDVIGLANMTNLPNPNAFEAVQLSSDRYVICFLLLIINLHLKFDYVYIFIHLLSLF